MDKDDRIRQIQEADERNMGGARDQILAVLYRHELEHHDGGRCDEERINAIAFMAHAVGLRSDNNSDWSLVRQILRGGYELRHEQLVGTRH